MNGAVWVIGSFSASAPNQPSNPSPADNATNVSTSPDLCVSVSDPNGGNLTVNFYARPLTPGNKFTIIGLPDTQYYTEEPQGQNSSGGGHMWRREHHLHKLAFQDD